jgi:hypothetical protein
MDPRVKPEDDEEKGCFPPIAEASNPFETLTRETARDVAVLIQVVAIMILDVCPTL